MHVFKFPEGIHGMSIAGQTIVVTDGVARLDQLDSFIEAELLAAGAVRTSEEELAAEPPASADEDAEREMLLARIETATGRRPAPRTTLPKLRLMAAELTAQA